jgi:hypothetical protein
MNITREQARDMVDAHAEGMHAELPREGCPECEDRPLRSYPLAELDDAPMDDAEFIANRREHTIRRAWEAADAQRAKFEEGKLRGLTGAPLRRLYDKWQRLSEAATQLEV